jgi:pimeloyl-ACP methyl ester carboxylesterase
MLSTHDVTAILTVNDELGMAVLRACRRRKVAVPEQVSVVGFDDVPAAAEAGLTTVHTPTLGGLHSVDDDRSAITLASQTAEVVALVDGIPADREVVLVGHSGGGAVIHGAVDARPQRVTRAVYVDSGPTPDGVPINAEIPSVGDDVPLPQMIGQEMQAVTGVAPGEPGEGG